MRFACLVSALLLAACASAPDAAAPSSPFADGNSLPPQTLEPGECGLFGWDVSGPPRFVFFATEAEGFAFVDSEIIALPASADIPSPDERYGPVTLRLGPGEDLDEGRRYAQARMKYEQADGFSRTVPMVAVESCGPVERPL